MADSPILKIPLLSVSQANKEQTINTMVSYLERAMNDAQTINLGAANFVITSTDFARFFMWRLTGVVSGRTITIPAQKRLFVVENLTGAFTVDLIRGTSTITVPVGGVLILYCDGTNLISVADSTVMGGGGGSVTAFVSLIDTFSSYAGQAGKLVRVKTTEDGLEPSDINVSDLADVNLTGLADGYTLVWDTATSRWVASATGGGGGSSSTSAIKNPVDVSTVVPVVLNTALVIGEVVDGIVLTENMRVLVKDQVLPVENGIYTVTASTPVRSTDAVNTGDFFEGTLVYVKVGTANGDKLFVQTEPDPPGGITPGSTPITFGLLPIGNLQSLGDVDVSTVSDGDALIWNATTSKWEPGSPGASYPPMLGNAGKVLGVNATEDGVEWVAGASGGGVPVLSVFSPGVLGISETLFRWVVPTGVTFTLPVGLAGSKFTAGVASTSTVTLTIAVDGTPAGTIQFNSSATGVATFTSAVVLTENSTLTISGGATPDPDLADISMSFKGA